MRTKNCHVSRIRNGSEQLIVMSVGYEVDENNELSCQ